MPGNRRNRYRYMDVRWRKRPRRRFNHLSWGLQKPRHGGEYKHEIKRAKWEYKRPDNTHGNFKERFRAVRDKTFPRLYRTKKVSFIGPRQLGFRLPYEAMSNDIVPVTSTSEDPDQYSNPVRKDDVNISRAQETITRIANTGRNLLERVGNLAQIENEVRLGAQTGARILNQLATRAVVAAGRHAGTFIGKIARYALDDTAYNNAEFQRVRKFRRLDEQPDVKMD